MAKYESAKATIGVDVEAKTIAVTVTAAPFMWKTSEDMLVGLFKSLTGRAPDLFDLEWHRLHAKPTVEAEQGKTEQ